MLVEVLYEVGWVQCGSGVELQPRDEGSPVVGSDGGEKGVCIVASSQADKMRSRRWLERAGRTSGGRKGGRQKSE